uniref:AlNc14C102G6064 protein n=1 Tax=Albugo laibachii Nc14 TaxID=890382 RepID=F0WHM7_9STRA|nr:AlNc14C102G6064 [Albugo laibachii Nc14]|eukprot:CCA20720.1 AlNc14C102G6064 [Albugo laibachii Nc14]
MSYPHSERIVWLLSTREIADWCEQKSQLLSEVEFRFRAVVHRIQQRISPYACVDEWSRNTAQGEG